MSTPKSTKAPAKKTGPVKYDSLRALKIAKSRKALPRGLKVVMHADRIHFIAPGQVEPVFYMTMTTYVEACLKTDGFKLADS